MYYVFISGAKLFASKNLEAALEAALYVRRMVNVECTILVTSETDTVVTIDVKDAKINK